MYSRVYIIVRKRILSLHRVWSEISLLTGWRRMASVRAATHCSLFSLGAEHFADLLDRFPVVRRTLESVAAQRLEKIGQEGAAVQVSSRADLDDDVRTVSDIIRRVTSAEASSADDTGTTTAADSRRPSHAHVANSRRSRRKRRRRSVRIH